MSFSALGLIAPLVQAAADLGFSEPTPVQAAAIPAILQGRDVWASARTGSGKTAAFVFPLLQLLAAAPAASARPLRALAVVPTHELAIQIGEVVKRLARPLPVPLRTRVVVGGVSINPQLLALRGGADVVIATPGRLLDLVARNGLHLGALRHVVFDEADRLFSLGFADEIASIIEALPAGCQHLLFSATLPPAVRGLAQKLLHEPVRIDIDGGKAPGEASIVQRAIRVDVAQRTPLLRHLLATRPWAQVLVFVDSQHHADHVAAKLLRTGVAAVSLHGALSAGARQQALEDFKAKRVRVLVATDLAARGLDIPQLPAVLNYDLPRSPVDYVHRIGRTGRAGETGEALSFVSAANEAHFRLIEKRHQLAIVREQMAGFEPIELDVPPGDPHGGIKGRRKSKKDKLREAAARSATPTSPTGSGADADAGGAPGDAEASKKRG